MILAVDPGLNGCGCALFDNNGALLRAGYVPNVEERGSPLSKRAHAMADEIWTWVDEYVQAVVCEVPQVYQGSKQKGDPNDLISLALVAGAVLGACIPQVHEYYYPRQWKGQLDEYACAMRVISRLSEEEKNRIEGYSRFAQNLAKGKVVAPEHNTFDAIGIGLKYVGRFDARKVIAR